MADDKKPVFDAKTMSMRDLKKAPIAVIKTEFPSLANALGIKPEELFRALAGDDSQRTANLEDTCCNSDSW